MKTIGLIGGMSWESSIVYYRIINETVRDRLGGLHSAQSLMYSVDFAEIEALQHQGNWEAAARLMVSAAQRLEKGGADCIVICTNTMHKSAPEVTANVSIPLLHIADATAQRVRQAGIDTIGLLGTRFTMEEDFYKGRLVDRHQLDVLAPSAEQRTTVNDVIYKELCCGVVKDASREAYILIIKDMIAGGAQGIILGCTEIGLLIKAEDCPVALFDTTRIHAEAAVAFALS
jgi:aspartate racemase